MYGVECNRKSRMATVWSSPVKGGRLDRFLDNSNTKQSSSSFQYETRDDSSNSTECEADCSSEFWSEDAFPSSFGFPSGTTADHKCQRRRASSCVSDGSLTIATDISHPKNKNEIDIDQIKPHCLLGEGHFGRVWLVAETTRLPEHGRHRTFALKKISKCALLRTDKINTVYREKKILQQLRHPGIVQLHVAYQDALHLYLLQPFLSGGELFTVWHAAPNSRMNEDDAKFYVACLVDALWYMHCQHHIVYRDLKPENIIIDANGFPVIVDFGCAKQLTLESENRYSDENENVNIPSKNHFAPKTYTMCGTSKYLPPEMVSGLGHSFSADYWSLGILLYELLTGEHPFEFWTDMDDLSLYTSIVEAEYLEVPEEIVSLPCVNIIDGLLCKKPHQRLGSLETACQNEILEHAWLSGVDILGLRQRTTISPWISPHDETPLDASNFDRTIVATSVEAYYNEDISEDYITRLSDEEQLLFSDF